MAKRFATAMNKGGVGKTTFTQNVAHSMKRTLRASDPAARVLIIDADTQAGATRLLTNHAFRETDPTISTLLAEQHTFADVIIRLEDSAFIDQDDEDARAAYAGIDLIPASQDGKVRLAGPEDFWALRDRLDLGETNGDLPYAAILMDCGYGDSDLNTLAMIAADHIVAVSNVTALGLNGIIQLINKVAKMKRSFPHMKIDGLVLNDYSAQELADQQMLESMREDLGFLLWEPLIPRRAIVKRSQSAGLPVAALLPLKPAKELDALYTAHADRMLALEDPR